MQPDGSTKSSRQQPRKKLEVVHTIPLELDQNNKEKIGVFQAPDDVLIGNGSWFAILPGQNGLGWELRVYRVEE